VLNQRHRGGPGVVHAGEDAYPVSKDVEAVGLKTLAERLEKLGGG